MKSFVKENTWLKGISCGWGNGYVIIPKGNVYHGKDYDDINHDVNVHYGLTFSSNANELDWEEILPEDKEDGGRCL